MIRAAKSVKVLPTVLPEASAHLRNADQPAVSLLDHYAVMAGAFGAAVAAHAGEGILAVMVEVLMVCICARVVVRVTVVAALAKDPMVAKAIRAARVMQGAHRYAGLGEVFGFELRHLGAEADANGIELIAELIEAGSVVL